MTDYALEIQNRFPVRRKAGEKEKMRSYLLRELEKMGYSADLQSNKSPLLSGASATNVVAGDPEKAKLILMAHYDTGMRELLPALIFPRHPALCALYQAIMPILAIALAFAVSVAVTMLCNAPFWTLPLFLLLLLGVLFYPCYAPSETHTDNGNTSGVAALLETAQQLTPRYRGEVALVFTDCGARGMQGAKSFRKRYPSAKEKTVLCLDCVGAGDKITVMPGKYAGWDGELLDAVNASFTCTAEKTVYLKAGGLSYYPGDVRSFKYGVAIFAGAPKSLCVRPAIRRAVDAENIRILSDGLCRLIASYQ